MGDAAVQLALHGFAGDYQLVILELRAQSRLGIETQLRLALALIRPVTFEAIVTQERTDLAAEVNLLRPSPPGN